MPIYEYQCPNGHLHERTNVKVDVDHPRICPECFQRAERVVSLTQRPIVKKGTPKFHGRSK